MKRAMVYLVAISVLLTALLSGCGEMKKPTDTTPTPAPKETVLPADMTPDESDGIVNDKDGIITENDNGGPLSAGTDGTDSGNSVAGGKPTGSTQSGSGTTAGTGKTAGMR